MPPGQPTKACRRPLRSIPVDVASKHGWPRTLGGVEAYLAILARSPELDGARVDQAVETGELWVVPAALGCIYLVPATRPMWWAEAR